MSISTSDTMTSVKVTSDVAPVDICSLALPNDVPGFLKISAELRNQIYENVFTAIYISSPVPHALTQVNGQIRSESRAMYYASAKGIRIWLRTPEQIKRAQVWLAEVDMSLYPSLPALELKCLGPRLLEGHSRPEITMRDSIVTINPENSLSQLLAQLRRNYYIRGEDDHARIAVALELTWLNCLGLPDSEQLTLRNPVPADFIQEAIEEHHSWLVRQWTCSESGRNTAPRGFYDMVFGLAANNKGRPWRMSDLQSLVNWFGERQEEVENSGGSSGKTAGKNVIYPLWYRYDNVCRA
jgi:hypothetical protein